MHLSHNSHIQRQEQVLTGDKLNPDWVRRIESRKTNCWIANSKWSSKYANCNVCIVWDVCLFVYMYTQQNYKPNILKVKITWKWIIKVCSLVRI